MEKVKIAELEIYYARVYRKIKVPRLEFENGKLTLILPCGCKEEEKLIERHKRWIQNRQKAFSEIRKISNTLPVIKCMEIDAFKKFAEERITAFSKELRVKSKEVVCRKLKSRWGSCSSKGKITVNSLLRYLPENLIEYILFHETAHLVEKKHNKRFYKLMEQKFKDTGSLEKQLSAYWYKLFYNKKTAKMGKNLYGQR